MAPDEKSQDSRFMKRALALARRGEGYVSPNPMVGAVIVRNGAIIAEGYHRQYGQAHAEIEALGTSSTSSAGATLYVNLEPCTHFGKTPPCIDRVIEAGIARAVIGAVDPNPLVAGKGIERLKEAGIDVTVGVLAEECFRLNESFFTYIKKGRPFVTLKYAQTLDGKIAATGGDARWISSEASRRLAHRLRRRHDAVIVGIGTVIADDPELTVRKVAGRNPLRVIVDSMLRIPEEAKVLRVDEAPTLIAVTDRASLEKRARLSKRGVDIAVIAQDDRGRVDLERLFAFLGGRHISSVLIEGGSGIITSCIERRLPHRLLIITAPKIMGSGLEAVGDLAVGRIDQTCRLAFGRVARIGGDLLLEARFADEGIAGPEQTP
ncbi:MAG: bifunctional diaminohydroxyphosphoribosylaminopyrimidine deaminase/5-amino-6-(5-phosphoribosylamino)uracil reductase RibD [Deltaproteobacteria bacterium]|nr:bifunctional diaminohydroxyphosphoribosylaminopyrimidine deaminase/5-amino-6-(5-phosphoribosylamino)uracil reductase RibD [Deltaproteobacteria bacterium]